MRILLLNDYGTLNGGAEIIVDQLREELRRRGHEVRLLTSSASGAGLANVADAQCFGTTSRWRTLLQSANPSAPAALARELQAFRPEVVHVNLYLTQLSPLILPLLARVPTVYYAQWYRAICPLGTKRLPRGETCHHRAGTACLGCLPLRDWLPLEVQRFLDARGRRAFTTMTAISQAVADELIAEGGPAFRRTRAVHAGTPRVAPREQPATEPLVFFAGRLVREKGVDVLLRAFARALPSVPAARLCIAGDGPEEGALKAMAASLGIGGAVEFAGRLSNEETTRSMRAAWAVCVPSTWKEPFGLVAAEAQMNGVAVVASRAGGLGEIVREAETGFLVAPNDEEALSGTLKNVMSSRQMAIDLGRNAHRQALQHLSMEAMAQRFELVYHATIEAWHSHSS